MCHKKLQQRAIVALVCVWIVCATHSQHAHSADSPPSFENDIAPILRTYCAGCHNDRDLEGELSVETFGSLRRGGASAVDPIVSGNGAESIMLKRIASDQPDKMPPEDEPQLPKKEIETLARWISAGAAGPARDLSILQSLVVPVIPSLSASQPITAAAWSPNGKKFAAARARTVTVYEHLPEGDPFKGAVSLTIDHLPGKVNALHFDSTGEKIVLATGITGLSGKAQIRSASTGAIESEWAGHRDVLYDAEISPDGSMLATAGYDRVIRLWKIADGSQVIAIDIHKGAIFDLAWHPSGTILASASADETVKLWRIPDGVRLDTLKEPQAEISNVLFTHDGNHILAAGRDKRIHMWQLISRDAPAVNPVIHTRFAHESPIAAIALSLDGRHLATSFFDRSIKLWRLPELALEQAFPRHSDIASVVCAAPSVTAFNKDQGNPLSTAFMVACMDGTASQITFTPPAAGDIGATANLVASESHVPQVDIQPIAAVDTEPNDTASSANAVVLPALIQGAIGSPGDVDYYRFHATNGMQLLVDVDAARSKSNLDSRVEILDAFGKPVEQIVLQATRDSWFTFRGKDSDTPDDFRVHNWPEMELNEYLYSGGEVVRLWLYPRGPDSGFKVYPGAGKRHTFFSTSALSHALGEPAWIVTPLPAGSHPAPSGLPLFRLNYENDDDPSRRNGADSLLVFTAPTDGDYVVKVSDVRDFGALNASDDYHYTLSIRSPKPSFTVTIGGMAPKVSPGSGREMRFSAERFEGFDGPIRIDVENLPAGFAMHSPIEIEAGQTEAFAVISAALEAVAPDEMADKAVKITASALIHGLNRTHELGGLGDIDLAGPPKVTVEILPGNDRSSVIEQPGKPLTISIHPGQTITAKVRAVRHDFAGRIELGGDDSGRNLSHGLFVDNIGLNGLLIVEGQTERDFFLTASPVAKPGTRMFHLRAKVDGDQASPPIAIQVLPGSPQSVPR